MRQTDTGTHGQTEKSSMLPGPQKPGPSDGEGLGVSQGNSGRWISKWTMATLGQKQLAYEQVIQGLGAARGKKLRSSQKMTYRG